MKESPWDTPVLLHIRGDGVHLVEGPLKALDWMLNKWPIETGPALEAAKRSCYQVLEGVDVTSEARKDFLYAATEALISVADDTF